MIGQDKVPDHSEAGGPHDNPLRVVIWLGGVEEYLNFVGVGFQQLSAAGILAPSEQLPWHSPLLPMLSTSLISQKFTPHPLTHLLSRGVIPNL